MASNTALYSIAPNGLPASSDVNQLVGGLNGTLDMGDWQLGPHVPSPTVAATAAVNSTPGNLNGSYAYVYTFVTGQIDTYGILHVAHETAVAPVSNAITPADQQATVTGIATSASSAVVARRLYRNQASGSPSGPYFLVATIADNSTTAYADNVADSNLGVQAPTTNTTGGTLTAPQFLTSGNPEPLYAMTFRAQGTATASSSPWSDILAFEASNWTGSAAAAVTASMQLDNAGTLHITAPQGVAISGYHQVVNAPTSGSVIVTQDTFGSINRVCMQFNAFVNDSGSTFDVSWGGSFANSALVLNGTGAQIGIGTASVNAASVASWVQGGGPQPDATAVAISSSTTALNGVVYLIGS